MACSKGTRDYHSELYEQARADFEYDFIQVEEGLSVSEDIFNRGLCLPSDIKNTEEDMQRIIQIVRRQFGV